MQETKLIQLPRQDRLNPTRSAKKWENSVFLLGRLFLRCATAGHGITQAKRPVLKQAELVSSEATLVFLIVGNCKQSGDKAFR